jgi:multimeric flavodoxin WrbA
VILKIKPASVYGAEKERMKTLLTYYSYSGITEKVVGIFKEVLEKRAELKIQRLKPKEEITSFFSQCLAASSKKRCAIEEVLFDATSFDTIIIGLPVWAFAPTPAINTYLDKVTGLNNKRLIVLLTSGSGMGVKMCFKYINNILSSKGASNISEINIPNARMKDRDFIISSLEKIL